jgi:hypothetical protein
MASTYYVGLAACSGDTSTDSTETSLFDNAGFITPTEPTLTVAAASPTITYGQPVPAYTAAYSGFLNGDTASIVSGTPSLTTNPATPVDAGAYTIITAVGTLSVPNYSLKFVNGTLTIQQAPVNVSMAASPSPAAQGSPVQLTASVTGAGSPAGTVVFSSGTATLCSAAFGGSSTASCSFVPKASGTMTITAAYQGDSNHLSGSASSVLNVYDTAITLQFSSTQLVYPGATNVTVCVAGENGVVATGSVQIVDGATALTSLTLHGNGCAYWYISPGLTAGVHKITASYSGDGNNPAGVSSPIAVQVAPVPVSMSVSCWNATFSYGADYKCTVNVSSKAGSALGSISYSEDGGTAIAVALANGSAGFTVGRPAAGSHSVIVGYAQQTNYAAAAAQTETFSVAPAPVNLSLTPSSWYASAGTNVTFSAAVASSSAGPPSSTGAITFSDGSTLLATVQVDSSGKASFTTASLAAGRHNITATYSGGANYASGSSSVTVTIAP